MLSVSTSSPFVNNKVLKKHKQRRRPKIAVTHTVWTKTSSPTALDSAISKLTCYDECDDKARRIALEYLDKLLARWALTLRTISNSNPNGATTASNPWQRPRVALVSFGSYRLGVHRKTSDLDVVAISPPSCTRNEFFTSLVALLKEDPKIEDVHPIPQAYTPVIKFLLHGFQIDMLFARVADPSKLLEFQQARVSPLVGKSLQSSLPRVEYQIDDSDLRELDEAGVRSLNGARLSQILIQLVPDVDNFRSVLKAVKEWALQAGIYSNVLGFLGGVNWAILVAWVCMKYPKATNSALLEIFFHTFATWKWPKPVLLTLIQETPPPGVVSLPAWNPSINPRDGLHIMPIITPAYPSMNSSYNVGMPQLRRIQDELILACNHLRENKEDFATLFKPTDFFTRHEHYIQVAIRAQCRQDFVEWFRLIESRLRLLISSLETQHVHAWPFARFFDRQYNADGVCLGSGKSKDENAIHESLFFIALRFAPGLENINLCHLISDFLHKINMWEGRKAGMDLFLTRVTSAELPRFVLMGQEDVSPAFREKITEPKENPQDAQPNQDELSTRAENQPPKQGPPDLFSPHKKCRINDQDDS